MNDVARLGTARRLARLTSDDGFFLVAALDHPENYLALFDSDVERVPYDVVVRSKLELAAELSRHASAVLLDPVWSLAQAVATGVLPGSVGVIAALDMLRYTPGTPPGWDPTTRLRPGWTPEKAARLGVDGVKLVVLYRADLDEPAAQQRKLVAELVASCRALQLPLVIEPIWYPLAGEDPADRVVARRRAQAIVASAAEFAALGARPVGISSDPVAKQSAFAGAHSLGYPLLSDTGNAVAKELGAYRSWLPAGLHTRRMTFVIDSDRRLVAAFGSETQFDEHADRALEILRAHRSSR